MTCTIKLYAFSKDVNSTEVPGGSAGTQYTGLFVEPCSVLNPTVKVSASVNAYTFNYAYISEFSRYYFITDCTTENGFWYITMKVDPLASFKSTIGNSTQYIERCAANQDPYILDMMYPPTSEMTYTSAELETGASSYLESGTFVLNITGSSQSTLGSYACDWHTFKNVINEMVLKYDDNNWWTNLNQGVRNSIWQPFKHLGNVIWFPSKYIDTTGITAIHRLYLGNVYLDGTGVHDGVYDMTFYHLTAPSYFTASVSLPKHPQAATYGKYMNLKPFTQYTYKDGIFGQIELDPAKLVDATTVGIHKWTDPMTGVQVLRLPGPQYRIGQVGVLIPMENNSLNIGGFLASTVASAAYATEGNVVGMAAGITSALSNLVSTTTSTSQMGSTVLTSLNSQIMCSFWNSVGHDSTHKGNAYCRTGTISSFGGYIKTSDAHIKNSSMTATEQEMIEEIMDSGFYYA